MKLKLTILSCLLTGFTTTALFAQNARFPTEGTIEFERSINMYGTIQKDINKDNTAFYTPLFEQYKREHPQFKTFKSTLYFSKNKTLYKPENNVTTTTNFMEDTPNANQINTTFLDLNTREQVTQKKVFEETFLVKDTARTINWKITSETREIAGYNCRRANAVIMDSIYVVAFYTDQIAVSGGPESFNGLPGMILGVALPHENVTWFAKTVTDKPLESSLISPPVKGKASTNKSLLATLKDVMKNWGDYAQSYLKAIEL